MPDLSGKHGLIVGVANKRSISWAIAQAAAAAGARLALTYPSERLEENVRELAAKLENPLVAPCDVASDEQITELGATLDREFGGLVRGGNPQFQGNRSNGNVGGNPRGMRPGGGRPPHGPHGAGAPARLARRNGPGRKRSK